MKIAELKVALDELGVSYTSKMRKAELEQLLLEAGIAAVTKSADVQPERLTPPARELPLGCNIASIRAFRRNQSAERDRQARARKIKRFMRAQGEQVTMNPGTRRHKR